MSEKKVIPADMAAKYGREKAGFVNIFKSSHPKTAKVLKRIADLSGYKYGQWLRVVAYESCVRHIRSLGVERLDALEVSAGEHWRALPFKSYAEMNYPEYDICSDRLPGRYDLIICDNVFEHLPYPGRAARNILAMLRPGGTFVNITPFMVRVHNIPIDCTRWTEAGMKYMLIDAGFDPDNIETGSWGNRECVKANFKKWVRPGWFAQMRNEARFPLQVWAFARAPAAPHK